MYMTRFPINRSRRDTPRLLGSPYCMHAAVAASFPPSHDAQSDTRTLWRVDMEPSGAAWLYIVSRDMPSLVGMDEQIGFPDCPPAWESRDYSPFLNRLAKGQEWSFRLVANPVRSVARNRSQNTIDVVGKRISHLTVRQQASWLIGQAAYSNCDPAEIPEGLPDAEDSRAAYNGFEVLNDHSGNPELILSERHKYRLDKRDKTQPITLVTVRFDGVLRVSNVDRLRHALINGIGHAKAFGCGLLTLAPLA